MKEFWALVGNSLSYRKDRGLKNTIWWKIYVAFFIFLGLGGYSLSIYQGIAEPFTLLIPIPSLLWLAFAFSIGSILHEWKSQTITWWLTLPYTRAELLLAKLVANFIRLLKIEAASIPILGIVAVEGHLLNPALWTPEVLGGIAGAAFKLYCIVIAVSPLAITLGIFLGVLLRSQLRPLMPIIWGVTIFIFTSVSNYIDDIFKSVIKGAAVPPVAQIPLLNQTAAVFFSIVILILMSVAIFGISSYILAEQTEI